jgi:hypothetical protein
MQWYKITLNTAQVGTNHQMSIWEDFFQTILPFGAPKDAALFITIDPEYTEDRSNPIVISIYFSPKAAELCPQIIARYQGGSCNKPDHRNVKLLGGHGDSELLLHDAPSLLQ